VKIIRFGTYEADVRSGELRKHGIRLRLQEQPFQVLCMLLERPGELVTREELRQRLWPADTFVDFDHGLNTAMNKLRDVLGDSAANPKFVETLAKRGYRFVGPLPVLVEEPSAMGLRALARVETAEEAGSGLKPFERTDQLAGLKGGASTEVLPRNFGAPNQLDQPRRDAGDGAGAVSGDPLPSAPRGLVRTLFGLVQGMYLSFYIIGLARLHEVYRLSAELIEGGGRSVETAVLITASVGIAIRLYLLTAVLFDYRPLGWKFQRIFPLILVLDFVWALSPYLLMSKLGAGLATAACAALLYLPFSQRTLVRMAYKSSQTR